MVYKHAEYSDEKFNHESLKSQRDELVQIILSVIHVNSMPGLKLDIL